MFFLNFFIRIHNHMYERVRMEIVNICAYKQASILRPSSSIRNGMEYSINNCPFNGLQNHTLLDHFSYLKSRNFSEQKISRAETFANINFHEWKNFAKVNAHKNCSNLSFAKVCVRKISISRSFAKVNVREIKFSKWLITHKFLPIRCILSFLRNYSCTHICTVVIFSLRNADFNKLGKK